MSFKFSTIVLPLCLAVLAAPLSNVMAQDEPAAPGITPAAIADEMSDEEMMEAFSMLVVYNQIGQMRAQLEANGFELNSESALEGARRAFAGEEVGIPMEKITTVMGVMQKRYLAANAEKEKNIQAQREKMLAQLKELAAKNKAAGDAFMKENGAKEGVKTLDGGVQYEILTEGTGDKPLPTDKIKINYHGTFVDGTVFDSTVEEIRGKAPEPYTSSASGFVAGFNTAVQSMPTGSKWKIVLPPEVAYKMGRPGVMEPNKTLIFEVELLEIVKSEDGEGSSNK